jgi:transketolase
MAIAEVALAARFNRPGHSIVDHYTYVLASDGDLEEGISSEAGSDAGHLALGKLIVLYADNHITIEGSTELAFTEDRMARFAAFGWHVQRIEAGNDINAVASALQAAREETTRPSLILVRTHIGFGSPHKQDTAAAHGEPLGVEEVRLTKERLGWPVAPPFYVPAEALEHFRKAIARGRAAQAEWELRIESFTQEYPDLAAEFQRVMHGKLPPGWDTDLPAFTPAGFGKDHCGAGLSFTRNDGRLGRSRSQYLHEHQRGRKLRAGQSSGTQHALRHPRACDGRHFEWHGTAPRPHPLWWDLPGLQ